MALSSYRGQDSDPISDIKDKASDQLGKPADQAERVANRAADQGRQAGERMQEVADNFKGTLDKSLMDLPMATLATSAIAGFVIGTLWKS